MKKELLRINRLNYNYTRTRKLENVSFCILEGECIGFLGLSYSGKDLMTSLLRGELTEGDGSGAIYLGGQKVNDWEVLGKGSVSGEAIEDDGEDEEIEFDENDVKPAEIVRSKEGELTELNAEDTRNMLLYIADKIIANKPYLTEIDSAIGDGDHGIGMAGGMQKAKKKLLKMAGEENAYQLFETAGQAMLMSMGGASGVIFGSLYLAGAKGMDPKSVITSKDLADMEKKSLEAIQERGGAQVGDKTMVDALSPAVDALAANADKGLLEMLKAAEESAKQGVEDTKKYVAKFGRAKSLLERAIGHQDAGATSVYLIFQGMREFVEGKLA